MTTPTAPSLTAPAAPEAANTIVRLNRSTELAYSSATVPMYPDLDSVGPSEYDLRDLELWFHDEQKDGGVIKGDKLQEYLKQHDMLKSCLGFHDALAIQRRGADAFRWVFGDKVLCFPRCAAQKNGHPEIYVPSLYAYENNVSFDWAWDGNSHGREYVIPRFKASRQ